MRKFKLMALASTATTYFLIFFGGLVRVSGAGLGCPDWPKCFGRWFPPTSVNQLPADIDPARFNFTLAWIEYINRLIGMTVGLLIAATAVWALIKYWRHPKIVIPAVMAALLVAFQGWQGGRMIASQLDSMLISVHMGLAFILAALMVYLTMQAYLLDSGGDRWTAKPTNGIKPWLIGLAVISILQVVSGTQMRTALEVVGEVYPLLPQAEWMGKVGGIGQLHTVLGILVTLATWQVGAKILRQLDNSATPAGQATWALIILATLEVIVGGIAILAGAPPLLQLFHLLFSALYIGALVIVYGAVGRELRTT